ncbi:MAG: hypothetical protein C4530_13665 [Desulfobacteraceae bacterium]|nr:MAG: hypothetical protein C4530_13665 [Desulfobacteraceae bacterium]
MDFDEKSRIRIEHWLVHNESHQKEYDAFALELETAGKSESASCIRDMAALTLQGNERLRRALKALESRDFSIPSSTGG